MASRPATTPEDTLVAAKNYALSLLDLKHWEVARRLLITVSFLLSVDEAGMISLSGHPTDPWSADLALLVMAYVC